MCWSPTELSAVIIACAGALALLIHKCQMSRCSDINLCCLSCKRKPPSIEEQLTDIEAQHRRSSGSN